MKLIIILEVCIELETLTQNRIRIRIRIRNLLQAGSETKVSDSQHLLRPKQL
jgi:hypothetical protein